MLIALILYLTLIVAVSRFIVRRGDNLGFYDGGRQSPWLLVAYGMVGASISGVTFVSVPGMVLSGNMSYLQMCLGFIPGYLIVALVLLPLFYRRGDASIYAILSDRLGWGARRVGSLFFILSDMVGTAVKFFLVCTILQQFVFAPLGLPFTLTVPMLVAAIWLYTRKGGVRTLVFTDVLQTTCMLLALLLIIYNVCSALSLSPTEAVQTVMDDSRSQVFVWDGLGDPRNFWKMFVTGAFTVVVMTGLNQNMMQKNLTCRTLPQAKKNMVLCGLLFTPVNALFLALGILLVHLYAHDGTSLPSAPDQLLPTIIGSGRLGQATAVLFTLGVASAAFSSADSSLTALTTTCMSDLVRRPDDRRLRHITHCALAIVLVLLVFALREMSGGSLIDTIYTLVGYTYGPLLALFALAMTQKSGAEKQLPFYPTLVVCLAAPAACYLLSTWSATHGYTFGYELLLINALLAYVPLYAISTSPSYRR